VTGRHRAAGIRAKSPNCVRLFEGANLVLGDVNIERIDGAGEVKGLGRPDDGCSDHRSAARQQRIGKVDVFPGWSG
jgi:hypothetical protein